MYVAIQNTKLIVSGVTRSMVIPGPETEVIGESGSGGLGAVPPDAEKGLILHVLRIVAFPKAH